MKIATWNINSVRLRIGIVTDFLKTHQPDILCLQETKVPDEFFPLLELKSAGYDHIVYRGGKSYNGVAIISKIPLNNIYHENFVNEDRRHLSATLPDSTEIHNLYIPAGGYEPDPVGNPSFKHKLDFYDEAAKWFSAKKKANDKLVLVGDLNVAPLEHDVWSHKQLLKVVSHTPVETEKMAKLKDSLKWIDTSREFVPHSEKLYSWWSYRNHDWAKSDRGRRLDHIWITEPLKPALKSSIILKDMRATPTPSDHVPVITELNL